MNKFDVGIIGNGFVGEAQAFAFSTVSNVKIYDTDETKSSSELSEVHDCDFVFVCVPTPMAKNGSQDLSYINSVFQKSKDKPIYIIKSTIIPGTTNALIEKYPEKKITFSPEFLTERTSKLDMLTQSRIILGGDKKLIDCVSKLYLQRFKNKNIIKTDTITAELIKYMNNSFFATKVSIMNEFKLLSEKIGANWDDALNGFASDGRIGDSHLNVPGHDGQFGYGGKCFPKDVCALVKFAKNNGIDLKTIIGGWETNLKVRKQKDWLKN
tara:strand:- start:6656 stop:7459 length:804 start_codon:yes stop_codon:yes gene_type:complete